MSPMAKVEQAAPGAAQPGVAGFVQRTTHWLRAVTPELFMFSAWSALTVFLLSLIFPPRPWWPLAFVALTPWTYAVCRVERAWIAHWVSFLSGFVFFLVNLSWLQPVTGIGYAALAFYLAAYWPVSAWAVRTGLRFGVSPAWTLPVVWTACEFLRAWVMSGFPWLFLAHPLYRQLPFIQISDLTGAYGVSFVVLLVNGTLVELALHRRNDARLPRSRMWKTVAATAVILAATLAYGFYRLSTADFRPGPRVAVVQQDYPLRSTPPYGDPGPIVFASYLASAVPAALQQPHLLAFPETVWSSTQNVEFLNSPNPGIEEVSWYEWQYGGICHMAVSAFARGDYAVVNEALSRLPRLFQLRRPLDKLPPIQGPPLTVLVGSTSIELSPEEAYPRMRKYNSALLYDPDGQQRMERYDKVHLVPFGELVPFRYGRLHWLYRWLNSLSPFSDGGTREYSLTPGAVFKAFTLETPGGTYRFGTPICYEDVTPYVARRFTWDGARRRVDFLVNISNDGWFNHSAQNPQHLSICVFRAIENRVCIARAVNTGVSGFIDPNGRLYGLVETDGRYHGPGVTGVSVQTIHLDDRASFYGRFGDFFASGCLLAACGLWVAAVSTRWVASLSRHIAGRRKPE